MNKPFAARIAAMNAMYKLPACATPTVPADVADRLVNSLRPGDTAARLGGEVCVPTIPARGKEVAEMVHRGAGGICKSLYLPQVAPE